VLRPPCKRGAGAAWVAQLPHPVYAVLTGLKVVSSSLLVVTTHRGGTPTLAAGRGLGLLDLMMAAVLFVTVTQAYRIIALALGVGEIAVVTAALTIACLGYTAIQKFVRLIRWPPYLGWFLMAIVVWPFVTTL